MAVETLFDMSQVRRAEELGAIAWKNIPWDYLKQNARNYPNKEALVDTILGTERGERRRKTYKQFYDEVNSLIFNLLELGITRDSLIIMQFPNCIEDCYLKVATGKIGCKLLGVQDTLAEKDTEAIIQHVEPDIAIIVSSYHGRDFGTWYREMQKKIPKMKIYVVGQTVPEETKPFSDLLNPKVAELYSEDDLDVLQPNIYDVHLIIPTGGTTGMPKLVMQSLYSYEITQFEYLQHDVVGAAASDVTLLFGPLCAATPLGAGFYVPLSMGAKMVFTSEYDEELVCRMIEEEGVTILAGVPPLIARTVTSSYFEQYNTSLVRMIEYAGAPFAPEIGEKLWPRGIRFTGWYGMTEIGACTGSNAISDTKQEQLYTIGKVRPGFDVKLVNARGERVPPGEYGEVLIWYPHLGYYKQMDLAREAWDEEGYIHSGDIGVFDKRGNLTIVGRSKDMILRGAENVFPKEVEDILMKHPKVRDVAIVGMPDSELGERACAYVVVHPGEKFTFDEMITFLKERDISKYKWPERLELINALPLSPGHKVKKEDLRADITEKLKKEGKI